MVSTEDKEIFAFAIKYGASVPFMRNEKATNNTATLYEVLLEVIFNNNKGIRI